MTEKGRRCAIYFLRRFPIGPWLLAGTLCWCGLLPAGIAAGQSVAELQPSTGAQVTSPGRSRQARRRRRRQRWDGSHRVRPGETLSAISRRYGVSVAALRHQNRIRGSLIRDGQRLRVPGRGMGRQRPRGARPESLTEAQELALARAERLGLSHRTGNQLLVTPPDAEWIEAAGDEESLDGTLQLPIDDGVLLRGWGSGPRGYHLALDIGAPTGTDLKAAERGLVLYAGNGIRGYGNVIILAHPTGITTWYGHNHQNLVVPGQRVERGETIGTVGQTGYARGPHVHFMLVDGLEHCDPRPLLVGSLQTRQGDALSTQEPLRWLEERPADIRCATRAERPHPRRRFRRRRRR